MSDGPDRSRPDLRARAWLGAHPTAGILVPLLLLVLASRLAALPATVWEQDEAYLAMAVDHFDPLHNRPQPPWSPLWVGLGHAGHALGLDATRSLQLLSVTASVASLLPLVAMWSGVLGRGRAVLASLLFLATPVAWLSAGRALSETPATAALAVMCACWCGERRSGRALVWASLAGAAAFLIRPQLLPAVALPALVVAAGARGARERARMVVPGLLLALVGAAVMVLAGGGVQPLLASLSRHATLHFGQLGDVSHSFAGSGLSRSLLHPGAAAAWVVLTVLGAVSMLSAGAKVGRALRARSRRGAPAPQSADDSGGRSRGSALVLVAALAGSILAVYPVASPQRARYFIPVLALSAGFVVAGTVVLLRRATGFVIVAAVALSAWQVIPGLALYRTRPSPPLAALRLAAQRQRETGAVIVVDHRLNAFVDYERAFGRGLDVVYDYEAQLGLADLSRAELLVAVFDANHPLAWLPAAAVERISWPESAVRRLSPDRYVDITVATAASPPGPSASPSR